MEASPYFHHPLPCSSSACFHRHGFQACSSEFVFQVGTPDNSNHSTAITSSGQFSACIFCLFQTIRKNRLMLCSLLWTSLSCPCTASQYMESFADFDLPHPPLAMSWYQHDVDAFSWSLQLSRRGLWVSPERPRVTRLLDLAAACPDNGTELEEEEVARPLCNMAQSCLYHD